MKRVAKKTLLYCLYAIAICMYIILDRVDALIERLKG